MSGVRCCRHEYIIPEYVFCYVGTIVAYRHVVSKLKKIYVKKCACKQSNLCTHSPHPPTKLVGGWGRGSKVFFTPPTLPTPMVGKLFLIMFECIFKFDGQIETVHVCNLTRLVFVMVHALLYTWYVYIQFNRKGLISEKKLFNLRDKVW